MESAMDGSHRWRFCRLGGFDQVRLETTEDIRHLGELDQKLWAALSCPAQGLEFDARTLALLDTSADNRVRVQEVLDAVAWVSGVMKNMDTLLAGAAELPLAAIDDSHAEGQQLLASARQLLSYLGKPGAEVVTIEDVTSTETLLHNSRFNGDGVVAAIAADDEETRQLITDIIACLGSDEDRSGLPGVSGDRVKTFFATVAEYVEWWRQSEQDAAILPFGEATVEAAAVYGAMRAKIDDYFTRCGLAAFDPKAEEPLNPSLATYEALAPQELSGSAAILECLPLARIGAGRPLPLAQAINPAWVATTARFVQLVCLPMFGQVAELTETQWIAIKQRFQAYEAWQAQKMGVAVEPLGIERVRAIAGGPGRANLEQLIARDLELADQVESIEQVVRLVQYNRDLYQLLNNFVSFRNFYAQESKAIFQAGTLFIDGRACELCIRVDNVNSHAAMANLSRTYLAYCDCMRRSSEQQMFIAVAFTGGDSDNLMVGRNGVFYDRQGNDWDATIIKIIDHPISVSQAFWAPYKRIARMVGEQIEKFAVARDKAVDGKAGAGIAAAGAKMEGGAAPTPFDVGKFAGIFAAIGLALGAIGTAVASIMGGFLSLPVWQMPVAIGGIILAVSGPSMLIAFLKLRQRNLGPILDANGWAVNTKASINIPFGSTLTKMAVLPKGAERSLTDPFAEKKTPWKRWVVLLVVLMLLGFAWNKGYIQQGVKQVRQQLSGQTAPAVKDGKEAKESKDTQAAKEDKEAKPPAPEAKPAPAAK